MAAPSSTTFFGLNEEELKNHPNQQLQQSSGEEGSPVMASSPPGAPSQRRKRNQAGNPCPDAEVIALSPKTVMATNIFLCEVCNMGFQRDQNLQLHRRGHNLPWKLKQKTNHEVRRKVYICPEIGCVHHDPSRALGDLTGIKKHFSRKHGEKRFQCDKCNKKYAVHCDWKAHNKICGTKVYKYECGIIFSSVLSVHVRGMDLKTNTVLRGNLHLVDLAGSERVDRSEATGDRLREAQHINKSLSALGDVIFALAQKSPHVPYRNSKLTQVLQSSLGGQAKTLMFVQLNPDVESYSETISTLKFAERVSGVELGAAQSNKEGRGVRDLMEQVALLKDAVARKDEEISHLLAKTNLSAEKRALSLPEYGSSSPRRHSIGTPRPSRRLSGGKSPKVTKKAASDMDKSSDYSDKHSEAGSPLSDDFRHHKEFFQQSRPAALDGSLGLTEEVVSRLPSVHKGHNSNDEFELLGFGDADSEERLSDISDGVLSMATETDGSIASIVEYTLFPETSLSPSEVKAESTVPPVEILAESTKPPAEKSSVSARLPRPAQKPSQGSSRMSSSRSSTKVLPSSKKAATGSSSLIKSNSTSSLLNSSRRRL